MGVNLAIIIVVTMVIYNFGFMEHLNILINNILTLNKNNKP
ncbi:hypothetical protein Metig_0001 [Methanotorris igneus Kol 5]|uniref:Uncharacterized protein n=1 Tax=Methanotorris igneus (strain DSM 5666 / JCM 11834 / Kol 5) TaxID=880724 RepID=F6BE27_METIK|nr:hypothetical protein Metig_0001 [Methanotorris igneus Kol 5]